MLYVFLTDSVPPSTFKLARSFLQLVVVGSQRAVGRSSARRLLLEMYSGASQNCECKALSGPGCRSKIPTLGSAHSFDLLMQLFLRTEKVSDG